MKYAFALFLIGIIAIVIGRFVWAMYHYLTEDKEGNENN
jgi:hypothetical protein